MVVVLSMLIVLAAPARADDNDAVFLKAMNSRGLSNPGGDAAQISLGHMICNLLSQGYSMNALEDSGQLHANSSMSPDDVKFLVQTSAAAYCPENIN